MAGIDHAVLNRSVDSKIMLKFFEELNMMETSLYDLDMAIQNHPLYETRISLKDLNHQLTYAPTFHPASRQYRDMLVEREALELTISKFKNRNLTPFTAIAEAGVGDASDGTIEPNTTVTNENITETMGSAADQQDPPLVSSISVGQGVPTPLADFLCRPVKIVNFDVAVGVHLRQDISIWQEYFSHPQVRAKLRNFAFIRCTLCVRISVTGSPFHTGRIMASYQPWVAENSTLNAHLSNAAAIGTTYDYTVQTYLSQARGMKLINVNENQPLDMKFPFVHPKPVARLYNSSATVLTAASSYDDIVDIGHLFLYSLSDIGTASSNNTTNIHVKIMGWLEDVELGAPTSTQIEITSESDERVTGPIENVSTNMYKITEMIEDTPVIGTFAKASTIVLKGVAGVASLFGWSYPVKDPTNYEYVTPEPFSNGANTIGLSTAKRITMDPKCELLIAPSLMATDVDEMSIRHISSRPSWFDNFVWGSEITEDVTLRNFPVHPAYFHVHSDLVNTYVQPTSCAYASQQFEYWHGTMEFHFEILCSKYHRGKIAFLYEPNIFQSSLIDTGDVDYNEEFCYILDIQEAQSAVIQVGWTRDKAWLKVPGNSSEWHDNTTSLRSTEEVNGYLRVVVFNELSSPESTPVQISVFVSCPDLRVTRPRNSGVVERAKAQSGVSYDTNSISSQPITKVLINPSMGDSSWISKLHFGEEVHSFRSLVKRFTETSFHNVSVTPDAGYISFEAPILPRPRPQYGVAALVGANGHSPIRFLRYAYLGFRGSVRKRIHVGMSIGADLTQFAIARLLNDETVTEEGTVTVGSFIPYSRIQGSVAFKLATNAGIEFECPFYSQNLFTFSSNSDDGHSSVPNAVYQKSFLRNYVFQLTTALATTAGRLIEESAAGEDFDLLWYLGPPYFTIPV